MNIIFNEPGYFIAPCIIFQGGDTESKSSNLLEFTFSTIEFLVK